MSDSAIKFCQRFANYCSSRIEMVLTTFQNHFHSILCTPDMKDFIDEAPTGFGDILPLFCEVCRINNTHTSISNILPSPICTRYASSFNHSKYVELRMKSRQDS